MPKTLVDGVAPQSHLNGNVCMFVPGIGLPLLVLLPHFVYLHLVYLTEVCLEMSDMVQLCEIFLLSLNLSSSNM
jgi:hypothetical protein